ncbi:MAG: calcium-binding protein [Pirellulales bacterium]
MVFRQSQARRRRGQSASHRRRLTAALWESLEPRIVLTGPYVNTHLSDDDMQALISGMQGLSAYGGRVSNSGPYGDVVKNIRRPDGTPVRIGDDNPLGGIFDDGVVNPLDDFFNVHNPATRDSDALVLSMRGAGLRPSIEGGLVDGELDEIRFDIHLERDIHRDLLTLDFSSPFYDRGIGLRHGGSVALDIHIDVHFVFGIYLDDSLNLEQRFFVRDMELDTTASVVADYTPLEINIGILQARVPTFSITGELGIHTGLDRTPDETVRLSDLNADNSLDIVTSTLTTNLFEGTFDVIAQVGNWEIAPSQYFEMAGEMLGLDPVIGFSTGFDEVLLFNRITTAEMVSAAERFGSWLGSLGELDAYDLAVPFTSGASVSTVYNVGTGMSGEIASLRDDTGNPVFETAQSFPLNDSMVYDPDTDQLRYTVSRSLPTQLTSSRRTRVAADDLLSLSSADAAEISADADVAYTLIFDLTEETADIGARTRVDDLRVTTSFAPSAGGLVGDAAFQSLGIQYADASLSGEYQVIADFGNPNPLGGALSLDQLYDRLNGSQQVFKRPIRSSGSSSLTLTGLSVIDNLFSFGDPGASITAVVSDLVSGAIDVSYDRAPELQSFENLTVDSMLDSLSEAILGTSDWSDAANESLATVDQTIENFVSVRQQKIVEAIDEGRADFDRVVTGTRVVLQDIPGFLNNLSVAVKTGFVTFSSNFAYHTSQGVLNLLFSADVEENRSVPVGLGFESLFDYTQEDEVSETMDFTGPRGEVDSFSSQSLDVGLDMDVSDPSHPTAYVNSATRLESRVYVNASSASGNAVSMDGASGSLGLGALGDGKLVIAQDVNSPNANGRLLHHAYRSGAQRVRLSDWPNFQPNKNAFGGLSADFEVTPDTTGSAEPVRLSFNISDLADALANTQLITSPSFPTLRSGIDLSLQLQSLGPSISELFSALEAQIKEQVLGIDLPLVGKSIDSAATFIRKMRIDIENVLGPLTAFDRATVEAALEQAIANLFGIPGDYRDAVQVDLSVPTALRFVFDFQGVPILQNVQAKTNFGLPALGAEVDANLLVSGLYRVKLDVVVSLTDGVYIDTSNESISVDLNVAMNGTAVGKLGFVEVVVATAVGPTTCSAFDATFAICLTDPNNDGKFKLNEIGRGSLIDSSTTGISGCSEMRFDITAAANEMLPSFRTGLNIDWDFNGLDLHGEIPEVTFHDVQLELGGFIAHVIAPFLTRLEPILDPIEPILDLLTSDLPVLDTAGVNASILDLGFAFAEHLPRDSNIRRTLLSILEFIEAVDSINRLANAVAIDGATGARLNVGNLTFGGSITPQYDARTGALAQTVIAAAQTRNDVMDQFFADSAAPHMGDVITTSRAQIHFPILENPTQVFEWLLGFGQAEIVTLKLPGVHANIPIDVPIPIFPGILEASIYGSITADMELMVGVDTYGASEFQKTGNGLDFLKGFYVSDRENADGTGRDVPELPIVGKALAGLGVGFDVGGVGISAKVGGGIEATIDFDLIDPDNDGKVRGFELSSPKGCLAINGSVSATLEASATVGFLNFDFPIASAELGRFNTVVHCSRTEDPANLGRINQQTGELVVFMGPTANRRSVMSDVVDEEIEVVQNDTSITIYAFGASESFDLADVTSIYVDGGTGADRILIDASVTKPTVLLGGEEDDFIQGGRGTDTIAGNSGNDEIHGGNGADTIYGNDGDDKLFGDDGIDTISGGDDNDEIRGGNGADVISTGNGVNTAYGDNGNDTLLGGDERDNLYGGDDDDTLFGYGGRNVLLGDQGVDTIHGGLNDDVIHGGADGDFIYGSLGRDTIYGDTGDDEIHGDEGNDYLEGNDGNDTIFGELGLDTIYGGAQNDTIDGGVGDDDLHGEADDDTIYGRAGIDTIFGGEGGDILYGNGDNDVIHGEAGFDILMGGPGSDELFGDQGNDTIYGNDDDPNEDRSDPNFTDDDFIYGGPDSDSVIGGWGVDHIYGEAGGDVLQGNQDADFIDGGAGPDVIYGQDAPQSPRSGTDGADEIYAGDDNDTVYGGPATDLIRGGNGDDTIFGEQDPDLIFGDAENDTIDGGGADDEIDGGTGNDHIIGSAGRDLLYGNDGFDVIEGNGGDDRIRGNVGADLLYGDDGEDEIRGGTGNDTIRGGNDDDTLRGDDGDDLILGFLGNDTIDGDQGNDVLYGNQGDDTIRGGFGLDRIYGEVGRDTLFGNEGNDVTESGPGDDSVHGDDGEDALYGDEGIDEIWGGLGNDFIKAGNGIGDILHGDEGNDTIIGSDDGENDPNLKDTNFFGGIDGGDGDDVINSLGGSDIVDGGLGNDIIHGGAQADSIVGGPASITALQTDDDILYGDEGDDQVSGGAGDDVINGGDGTDTIDGGSGTNAIDDDAESPLPAFAPSPRSGASRSMERTQQLGNGGRHIANRRLGRIGAGRRFRRLCRLGR